MKYGRHGSTGTGADEAMQGGLVPSHAALLERREHPAVLHAGTRLPQPAVLPLMLLVSLHAGALLAGTASAAEVTNTVTVQPAVPGFDPNPGDNMAKDTDTVSGRIDARDDSYGPFERVDGMTGSVFANDLLDGTAANAANVQLTPGASPSPQLQMNDDGTISIIAGIPAGTYAYPYQICERATPGNCDAAVATVSIQSTDIQANPDRGTGTVNKPIVIPVIDNDVIDRGVLDPGSISIVELPTHGKVEVGGDGTVIYRPDPGFVGEDTFTYTVCERAPEPRACDTTQVTVEVEGRPPVATDDTAVGEVDQPLLIPAVGNDRDPDGDLDPGSIRLVDAPDGLVLRKDDVGTWTVLPDGNVRFDPATGFTGKAPPVAYTIGDHTGMRSNTAYILVSIPYEMDVVVTKSASHRDVLIGDVVRYAVTVVNRGASAASGLTLVDTPPAGFSYVDASLSVDDADGAGRLIGLGPLRVADVDIAAGGQATISYMLRVGAGVRHGEHVNHAKVIGRDGRASMSAHATVRLEGDPLLEDSLIVGTVFDDRNGDGWQDDGVLRDVRVKARYHAGDYMARSTWMDRGHGVEQVADHLFGGPLLAGLALGDLQARSSSGADPQPVTVSYTLVDGAEDDGLLITGAKGPLTIVELRDVDGQGPRAMNAAATIHVERTTQAVENGMRVQYTLTNQRVRERGIPGVRIVTVDGLLTETDAHGRYHIAGIHGGEWERGRNVILKLDPLTLPAGTRLTTPNPLVRRVSPGLPIRFDFGALLPAAITPPRQRVESVFQTFHFAPGQAQLLPEHRDALVTFAERAERNGGGIVQIEADGESEVLAFARGNALKEALVAQLSAEVSQALEIVVKTAQRPVISTLGDVALLGTVLFDTDEDVVRPEFSALLDAIALEIERGALHSLRVAGHTDVRADAAYNLELSRRRSRAVVNALKERLPPVIPLEIGFDDADDWSGEAGIGDGLDVGGAK